MGLACANPYVEVISKMPSDRNTKSKYWCFTLNNYTAEDVEKINDLVEAEGAPANYVVVGKEVGESGTPHLQGYIEFTNRKTFASVKRYIGSRAHIEPRRGSQEEAIEYCKKDGNFYERGNPVEGGQVWPEYARVLQF